MPRRRAVTREQIKELLVLPVAEAELIRHWIPDAADLAAIERRPGDPNQLGFALQLCAFRYPGRLLRSRETIPKAALALVAGQLRGAPDALADYAARHQTRREQLRALRGAFGFRMFAPEHRRELLALGGAGGAREYRCCGDRRDVDGRAAASKEVSVCSSASLRSTPGGFSWLCVDVKRRERAVAVIFSESPASGDGHLSFPLHSRP